MDNVVCDPYTATIRLLSLKCSDHGYMQGTIDTLKHELAKAQQMMEASAERHHREEVRLQERHEALIRFTKVKLRRDESTRVVPAPRMHKSASVSV